jgi:hypothetical protein
VVSARRSVGNLARHRPGRSRRKSTRDHWGISCGSASATRFPIVPGCRGRTAVCRWKCRRKVLAVALKLVSEQELVKGERIGVGGSTMKANAALRTIVRRDNGETYCDLRAFDFAIATDRSSLNFLVSSPRRDDRCGLRSIHLASPRNRHHGLAHRDPRKHRLERHARAPTRLHRLLPGPQKDENCRSNITRTLSYRL